MRAWGHALHAANSGCSSGAGMVRFAGEQVLEALCVGTSPRELVRMPSHDWVALVKCIAAPRFEWVSLVPHPTSREVCPHGHMVRTCWPLLALLKDPADFLS